jgi:hypothetical protein
MNSTRKVGEIADRPVAIGAIDPSCAHPPRSARRPVFALLFSAIEEGLASAARYEALARKTNGELANLGTDRADLPRFVMFGNG